MASSDDAESIFEAARQIPDHAGRHAYLTSACGGNPALQRRVERLLRASTSADRFFAESAEALTNALESIQAESGSAGLANTLRAHLAGEEAIGSRIGRYKIVRTMGEGGCGIVYEAEQQEPVRRRVALKVIKLGMESKSVIARFEAERQALAMMDHPNIAHVLDAGATRRGSPYFVMELVRGVKITDYCDQNRLDTKSRLELFIQVCHAIQHAHQKAIVHGDIKPSNIMVTLVNDTPVPKVIDFGVAKAIGDQLGDGRFTGSGEHLIGTPTYMSPEQSELGAIDIDTRSDIYSLGVLLYELLTGSTPFSAAELGAGGIDAMRQIIRERDPERPSVRVRQLPDDTARTVANARRVDRRRLVALLSGDLDAIVMKALEKDRRRRYETANGFAVDIQRHFNSEPVAAHPPNRGYRLEKLIARNRGIFAAIAAVTVTLVVGLATSTWLFFREREARERAVQAEQQETKLRRDAEVRQKVTQAALLVSQDRFQEADAVLANVNIASPTVEGAAVFRALGEWHAVEGHWSAAAARFNVLLDIDLLDGWDVSTLDFLRQGPALVEANQFEAYDRFRRETLRRYASSPIQTGDRVLKISLLTPADDRLLAQLQPYAAGTNISLERADSAGDAFTAAWQSMSLALWRYRVGDWDGAMKSAERCLGYADANAPRSATAWIIQAMVDRRLNRADAAAARLALARTAIESHDKARGSRGTPVLGFWFDWEFARILYREAATDAATTR